MPQKKDAAKGIADRIWNMRNGVRENETEKENQIQYTNAMDHKLNLYLEEFGLPSGYSSKEELQRDIDLIMNVACVSEATPITKDE